MATNTTLTSLSITPQPGMYALLPNQPILHTCLVSSDEATTLVPGAIVSLEAEAKDGNENVMVVKQAAVTDLPIGVVAGGTVKSAYTAGERISVYPTGSYVYMTASGAINRGVPLYFDANNQVTSTATGGNSVIGISMNAATAANDIIIVLIQPQTTTA